MPSVFSVVPEINDLHFVPWNKAITSKPSDVKLVRVDGLLLANTKSGLTCNSLRNYAYMMGNWSFNRQLLQALVRFGKITPKMMNDHLAACERAAEVGDAKADLANYERIIKRYGSIRRMKAKARHGKRASSKRC